MKLCSRTWFAPELCLESAGSEVTGLLSVPCPLGTAEEAEGEDFLHDEDGVCDHSVHMGH
jgi:hypothetical protein